MPYKLMTLLNLCIMLRNTWITSWWLYYIHVLILSCEWFSSPLVYLSICTCHMLVIFLISLNYDYSTHCLRNIFSYPTCKTIYFLGNIHVFSWCKSVHRNRIYIKVYMSINSNEETTLSFDICTANQPANFLKLLPRIDTKLIFHPTYKTLFSKYFIFSKIDMFSWFKSAHN